MEDFIIHDYLSNEEKLYHRKKIIFFKDSEIRFLCLHFLQNEGFEVPVELDFLGVDEKTDLKTIKEILSKEQINAKDLAMLIYLFDTTMDLDHAERISKHFSKRFNDINQIYFSL